jgi:hypothetical protein
MKTLRSIVAVMALGMGLYTQDSGAVLTLSNGTDEISWFVGQPAPSINLAPYTFVVVACGAELTWVYANFPTIPMRSVHHTPTINDCVIWRGDNARFIADNLRTTD